jgi:hypothetical protein
MNATTPSSIQTSPSIAALSTALIKFHSLVPKIPKSCRNPFLKSKYADLSTILDIVQPVLNECELVIMQHPTADYGLTTILSHSSGEWVSSQYQMQPTEQTVEKAQNGQPAVKGITPQSIGSVITYQRRYAIGAILSLNIDDDTDGHVPGLEHDEKPAATEPKKSPQELMAEAAAREAAKEQAAAAPPQEPASAAPSAPSSATVNQGESDGDSTQVQRDRILQLYTLLNITPEQQLAILAKRGLSVLRSLSSAQAVEIINALEKKLGGQNIEGRHQMRGDEPCTDTQVQAIKSALETWEQSEPGATERFVASLNGAGFAKIADLTHDQARSLLADIEAKNIANFFGSQLQTASGG